MGQGGRRVCVERRRWCMGQRSKVQVENKNKRRNKLGQEVKVKLEIKSGWQADLLV